MCIYLNLMILIKIIRGFIRATRSLLNTAKVMENNPVALRLKELETLERVAERIDNISVFGGLDQVLHGLVNIKG